MNDAAGVDAGSAYVFERNAGGPDTWGEVKKLSASDPGAGDFFGISVSISVDTVVVGARDDDSGSGPLSGSAFRFERNQGGADNWGEVQQLIASDANAGDRFGQSISISGDTIIVGAHTEDAGGLDAGAVYIFATTGEYGWNELAKPVAEDAAAGDEFGAAAAISGDTIVVGAQGDDDAGSESGAAYVFARNHGDADSWGQVRKLVADDAAPGDEFGASVSISKHRIVVGAPGGDDEGTDAGAAYVFERNAGGADNWGRVKKVTAPDAAAGDRFGASVSVADDRVAIGAASNGHAGTDSGAAYVFARNQGGADNWGDEKKLTAPDAAAGDRFGTSVSIRSDRVAVGAAKSGPALAAFGASTDPGAAYVFARNQGGADNWGHEKKLTAPDAAAGDRFGTSVSVGGDRIGVGAASNGHAGADSGAAYVFARNQGGADNWGHEKKLTAADAAAGDRFGTSVSIRGDRVAVGAASNGHAGTDSGAAYRFERNRGGADNWGQAQKLVASDAAAGDHYGQSISISGDSIVVGAHTNDDGGSDAGAVYVLPEPAQGIMLTAGLAMLGGLSRLRRRTPAARLQGRVASL